MPRARKPTGSACRGDCRGRLGAALFGAQLRSGPAIAEARHQHAVRMTPQRATALARLLIDFLETGDVPDGLFTADVFCDFTMPQWRLQSAGVAGLVALRKAGHPGPGTIPRWRCDATSAGFVLEFEEQWNQNGQDWYSRELARADAPGGLVSALSVYCTGDWDTDRRARHAATVTLIRP